MHNPLKITVCRAFTLALNSMSSKSHGRTILCAIILLIVFRGFSNLCSGRRRLNARTSLGCAKVLRSHTHTHARGRIQRARECVKNLILDRSVRPVLSVDGVCVHYATTAAAAHGKVIVAHVYRSICQSWLYIRMYIYIYYDTYLPTFFFFLYIYSK